MKTFFALAGAASAQTQMTEADHEFLRFVAEHGKSYGTKEEFEFRAALFKENYEFVQEHNSKNSSFTVAINEFADMSANEKKALFSARPPLSQKKNYANISTSTVPDAVNWVDKGAVTPIKNQKQCGSCWAFSSTGAIEALYFFANDELLSFSEQQLIDCTKSYKNQGCNGGWMDYSFEYYKTHGAEPEKTYPYKNHDKPCKFDPSKAVFEVSGYQDIKATEDDVKAAVAQQPVSVAINSDLLSFLNYDSGIYDDEACSKEQDHAVLIVGYGTEKGKDYWLVKNSWGTGWGERGYIRMTRKGDICGILDAASIPIA